MAEPKTQPTAASVDAFVDRVPDEQMRDDCRTLIGIMGQITGEEPRMWGPSIVGFGNYRYTYASGRQGDWMLAGFSPRKQAQSLYLTCDIRQFQDLLEKLGPHSCGKGCLYVKRLADVHLPTLKKLIKTSMSQLPQQNAANKPKAETAGKRSKSNKKPG